MLDDLDPALTCSQHLFVAVERHILRIICARSRREDAAVRKPASVFRQTSALSERSDKTCSIVAVFRRTNKETRDVSTLVDAEHMPTPPSAKDM